METEKVEEEQFFFLHLIVESRLFRIKMTAKEIHEPEFIVDFTDHIEKYPLGMSPLVFDDHAYFIGGDKCKEVGFNKYKPSGESDCLNQEVFVLRTDTPSTLEKIEDDDDDDDKGKILKKVLASKSNFPLVFYFDGNIYVFGTHPIRRELLFHEEWNSKPKFQVLDKGSNCWRALPAPPFPDMCCFNFIHPSCVILGNYAFIVTAPYTEHLAFDLVNERWVNRGNLIEDLILLTPILPGMSTGAVAKHVFDGKSVFIYFSDYQLVAMNLDDRKAFLLDEPNWNFRSSDVDWCVGDVFQLSGNKFCLALLCYYNPGSDSAYCIHYCIRIYIFEVSCSFSQSEGVSIPKSTHIKQTEYKCGPLKWVWLDRRLLLRHHHAFILHGGSEESTPHKRPRLI